MEIIKIQKAQGYLWQSDKEQPDLKDNENIELCLDENVNPFIVEGQLYDVENHISYSIRYIDGKYLVCKFSVKDEDLNNPDNEYKTYFSNRMKDRKLKFLRYWEPRCDANCLDMYVLSQTKNVFIGFEANKD